MMMIHLARGSLALYLTVCGCGFTYNNSNNNNYQCILIHIVIVEATDSAVVSVQSID